MKKIIQLLILSLAFLGSANAVFYGAYGSEVYDVYKTEKNISGAFGMKLGVIYNQDFIKPTILEPVILDSLDEQATYIATLKVVLIEYESGYEKGNRVKGENAPQYLTEFRLQVNQHKQSYQITAFSDEMKKENCQKYQVDFMKALDRMGVVPEEYNDSKYKDYFSKMTDGKKYINYHDFISSLPETVYPKVKNNKK